MTVSEGYPDYQRVQTRALAPLVNEVFDTGGVLTNMGPYYVSNYPEILVKFIGDNTADYSIDFQWYADAAMTQLIYVKSVAVTGNVPVFAAPVKVAGPYLNVAITPNNWVTGLNVQLIIVPSYNPMSVRELNYPLLLEAQSVSAPASGTATTYLGTVIEGPVVWFWNVGASAWTLNLQTLDTTLTWHSRYFLPSTVVAATDSMTVVLPPRPCRVVFTNSDATAKSYSSTIGSLMY